MALIECPKCKAKVSDKAYDCPKCGHHFSSGSKKINIYLLAAVIVVGCFGIYLAYKAIFHGSVSVDKRLIMKQQEIQERQNTTQLTSGPNKEEINQQEEQKQLENQTKLLLAGTGIDSIYWKASGTYFHLYSDCINLNVSGEELFQGRTVPNKTMRLCPRCDERWKQEEEHK